MKNIHILPTDKPSRLYTVDSIGKLDWSEGYLDQVDGATNQNIYITSDEEIKENDWYLDLNLNKVCKNINSNEVSFNTLKKIILTTDQDLINDGVQAIPDEFLEWFVKNPSCEEVEVITIKRQCDEKSCSDCQCTGDYKIIIPIKEPKTLWVGVLHDKLNKYYPAEYELKDIYQGKDCLPNFPNKELCQIWCDSKYKEELKLQCKDCNDNLTDCICIEDTLDMKDNETLEEALDNYTNSPFTRAGFINGVNWQKERSYSELAVRLLSHNLIVKLNPTYNYNELEKLLDEQFKKIK